MEYLQERIKKLPKWVQSYIGVLERNVDSLKRERGDVARGDTVVSWRVGLGVRHHLPDQASVRFGFGCASIDLRMAPDDAVVRVSASEKLVIEPRAANTVILIAK